MFNVLNDLRGKRFQPRSITGNNLTFPVHQKFLKVPLDFARERALRGQVVLAVLTRSMTFPVKVFSARDFPSISFNMKEYTGGHGIATCGGLGRVPRFTGSEHQGHQHAGRQTDQHGEMGILFHGILLFQVTAVVCIREECRYSTANGECLRISKNGVFLAVILGLTGLFLLGMTILFHKY